MQAEAAMGAWGILLGVAAGAVRGSIPYLFVSLGECLTEKSGKINLGMEGVLLMGAMTAFAVSDRSGSPWLGLAAAAAVGALLGAVHAGLTRFPKVNDIAAGIAMILFGSGLAFFFGKKFVAPMAPQLPLIDLGFWSPVPALHSALRISPLFFFGIALAFVLDFVFRRTRWGLQVRAAGDDPVAARSIGIPVNTVRMTATVLGASPRRRRRSASDAVLSRHLVGGNLRRPGTDGRRARHLRPLESAALHGGRAALRWRTGARSIAAGGRTIAATTISSTRRRTC